MYYFGFVSKKYLLKMRSLGFGPILSLQYFIVLGFIFMSDPF